LAFEPGEKWQYSNAGFIILGAIIERVGQQNYFDYTKEHIYLPAHMTNTDAYEMDHPPPNLAIGYTQMGMESIQEPGVRRNNLFLHAVKGGPAGSGFSTVEDLFNFSIALQEHKLLSAEYTNIVLTGKVRRPSALISQARYGYGFGEDFVSGTRIVGHNGGAPGINCELALYIELGYTVIVLSNYDGPAAKQVTDWLRERLTQL
jgi:CubicO group peptidase (beta-lactamase class C family)